MIPLDRRSLPAWVSPKGMPVGFGKGAETPSCASESRTPPPQMRMGFVRARESTAAALSDGDFRRRAALDLRQTRSAKNVSGIVVGFALGSVRRMRDADRAGVRRVGEDSETR